MSIQRKIIILLAIVPMVYALGFSEDRRTDKSQLAFMTLNAEFLWDGVEPEEGRVNFPWKLSQTEAEEHMQEIAQIIIRSDPDIINLVEVEGMSALKRFNQEFLAGRGYNVYLVKGKDSFTGQDVGLLTRVDPENNMIERYDKKGKSGRISKSVSKNYFAKFKIGDLKIALIGLHFLARPGDRSRMSKRQAQADAMRNLAMELKQEGFSIVIAGDFNDFDGDTDCLDHIGSTPVTNVLSRIKMMDIGDSSDNLINAAFFVANPNRYTAFWDKDRDSEVDFPEELTAIDHILLSKELTEMIDFVDIPHEHDPREVTDHFPVVVVLKLSDVQITPQNRQLQMVRLMPNPPGNENIEEWIEIKNPGNQQVELRGWTVRDRAKTEWKLDGMLAAGAKKTIKRNGRRMALNNGGDTIDLIAPDGSVVQTFTYNRVEEGEEIFPPDG